MGVGRSEGERADIGTTSSSSLLMALTPIPFASLTRLVPLPSLLAAQVPSCPSPLPTAAALLNGGPTNDMPPATSWANPLGRLPHGSVPQSGFLSSTLTLVLVLVVLLAAYAVIQHRSRAADRRYCAWLQAQRGQDVHLLDGIAFRGSGFVWQAGPRWFLVGPSSRPPLSGHARW